MFFDNNFYVLSMFSSDIDECATGQSGCAEGCEDIDGSYVCTCPANHVLAADKRECIREFILYRYK